MPFELVTAWVIAIAGGMPSIRVFGVVGEFESGARERWGHCPDAAVLIYANPSNSFNSLKGRFLMMTKVGTKNIALLTVSTLFLFGCLASVPLYQGDMSGVPANLNKINKGKVRMGLPDGWQANKAPKHASNWAAEIQHSYKKKVSGGAAILTTLCFTAFLSKDDLATALRSGITKSDPNAVKIIGPNKVDTPSFLDPEFEVYNTSAVAEGMKLEFNFLIGWKLDSRLGGCKYGIFMVSPRQNGKAMLNDFLAILGSLE